MLPVEIHGCRWAWCREFFPSSAALAGHVVSVHLPAAQLVRRSELPVLRRVEEGYSQAFDLLSRADFEAVKPSRHYSECVPSSLPSPPPSTPTSLPSALPPSPPQQSRFPPGRLDGADHPAVRGGPRSAGLLPSTPEKTNQPTFASLSSPAESHLFSPSIPESPSLSRMISDAVSTGKRLDESPSKSSSSSRESVEQQLTQSISSDPQPKINAKSRFPSSSSARQHTVTIPDPQRPPQVFSGGQRQTWYQAKPKTKKRPRTLSVRVDPENAVPQSTASDGRPASADHSAGVSSTPDWSQSQTGACVDSQQFPYQTQASYDSQS